MQTVTLGKNGPTVTALGIGTWAWGDQLFWNYGGTYGCDRVREAYQAAVDAGITFFDTAEVYGLGESETLLGQFMQADGPTVAIATKYGPLPWRMGGDAVAEAVTASLKRLQRDRIELYQVHWPFTFFMSQETLMNALADEVERGRILAVGVSNYSAEQMLETEHILAKRGISLAVNQVQYSLLHRKIEGNGISAIARQLGVTILAYSPLAQGLLTGKYTPERTHSPDGARRFDSRFNPQGLAKIAPVLQQLEQLGESYGKTVAQVALNWLVAQGNVIPIPGAKNAQQAIDNAGALGWSLSAADIRQLDAATRDRV
jgi:aryl-alcohol dehydrogenase-like predicted oxidoreductase